MAFVFRVAFFVFQGKVGKLIQFVPAHQKGADDHGGEGTGEEEKSDDRKEKLETVVSDSTEHGV